VKKRPQWTAFRGIVPGGFLRAIFGAILGATLLFGPATAASAADTRPCTISVGTLDWGFKESFRSYITSSIAHGKWTVADGATYETPTFSWANGVGEFDPSTREGSLAFVGSIEFTGHGSILDTTIANPTFRFANGAVAFLDLDVDGTTRDGKPVKEKAVEFITLDLSSAKVSSTGGSVSIAMAPASLTKAGADAFGSYEAGEHFDPIDLKFTTSSACAAEFVAGTRGNGVSSLTLWLVASGVVALLLISFLARRWLGPKRRARRRFAGQS
jgi:Htaa